MNFSESEPLCSVIIPAHNAEKHLGACLESLQNQNYKNFEIIIVDDCSTDKTAALAAAFNVKIINNEKKQGEGIARNRGATQAQGKILVHTDSDVILPPDWLQRIVKDMREQNVECVGGGYSGSLGEGFIEKFAFLELAFRRRNMPQFVKTLVGNNFACTKDIFLKAGGFGEKYKCEDMVLSYKISRLTKIFWDKENGVKHLFRNSLKGYLKQQYYFARDTVITYWLYPAILLVKTHQGKQIYLETILTFLFFIFILILNPLLAAICLAFITLINLPFLRYLQNNDLPALKSLAIIFLRNLASSWGLIAGFIYLLINFRKIK